MQEIAFEIDAQRVGRASGYLGGLTVERYTFTGATLPAGTRLAILTRAGVTIAAAEITEGNAATVDTNTQEVADLLRYQPLGACESVYIALGNADTIIALIPAIMRKNWLDDEATHPPVPANRYPTKTELDEWLARFDERVAATAAAQSAAEAAASAARASATEAKRAAADAGDSAVDAEDSATAADGSKRAAEAAQGKAETAKSAAEAAQGAAQSAATSASESAKVASASEQAALTAKQSAETAQTQAQASETAAKASETAAKGSETAASASEQAAKSSEQAAAKSAAAAAGNASAAAESETAAAESATSASASATAANASANAASSSATAAAKSAAASASSASAAKQSETDLAEAVATAEGLDNRITLLENGKGVYKDPVTGKVSIYTPLKQCPDGTLKVVYKVGLACKVAPVEIDDDYPCRVSDNGEYVFILAYVNYWENSKLFIYDISLKRVLYINNQFGRGGALETVGDISSLIDVVNGFVFVIHKNGATLLRWSLDSQDSSTDKAVDLPSGYRFASLFYNKLSRHLCVVVYTGDYPYVYYILPYDTDLNPILDDNGSQVFIDVDAEIKSYANGYGYCLLGHRHVYGRTYVFQITNEYGAIEKNRALMVANYNDTLSVVHESVVVEDPDNPGVSLLERDGDGNIIFDDPSRSWLPRPVTTEGREIRFNVNVENDRGYAKNAYRCAPRFQLHSSTQSAKSQAFYMTDGIDTYVILKDGRFINSYQYIEGWPSSQPDNDYKPRLRAPRTGVTDCIVNQSSYGVHFFSVGGEFPVYSKASNIGCIAYAPWMTGTTLTSNVAVYDYDTKVTAGPLRFLPINLLNKGGNNASPLEAPWGFFGSPCWFATFQSAINGEIL